MRKHLTVLLLGGGAAAVALGLPATTAASSARPGWTVSPGGAFSFTGAGQTKDGTTGTIIKCRIRLSGTLKTSSPAGQGIGTVTSASFAPCTIATIVATVTVGAGSLPWELNVTDDNAGVIQGSIEDIDLVITAPGCSTTVDGTAAGANDGRTQITYTDSTGKINLLGSGGNLHSFGPTCWDVIGNGDVQKASGSGTVSPKQTFAGP